MKMPGKSVGVSVIFESLAYVVLLKVDLGEA